MSNCKICNVVVTDPVLKHVYYDPEHPNVDVGPYCEECAVHVRRCSGCFNMFHLDNVKYFDGGIYLCSSCEESSEYCSGCGTLGSNLTEINGSRLCRKCLDRDYSTCGCCNTLKENSLFIKEKILRHQYKGLFSKYKEACTTCFHLQKSRFKKYEISECKYCGEVYTSERGENNYCPKCVKRFGHCGICGKVHHNILNLDQDGSVNPNEVYVRVCGPCNSKINICSCGKASKNLKVSRGFLNNTKLCEICSKSLISQCKICLQHKPLLDNGYCEQCNHHYGENSKCTCGKHLENRSTCNDCNAPGVYSYSKRSPLYFHYTTKDIKNREDIFFGVEREVTYKNNSTNYTLGLKNLYKNFGPDVLLAKSDSSISGSGYEIVTQPMSLNYMHTKFNIEGLFDPNIVLDKSCGMHVHVGRGAFKSDLHIFRVVKFVNSNQKFIDSLCGRTYNTFNSSLSDKPSKHVAKKASNSRSSRVNLTNNKTIEFRLFAQAANEFEFKYRIEFTVALVRWTKDLSLSKVNVESFEKYVQKNSKEYPSLTRYLKVN